MKISAPFLFLLAFVLALSACTGPRTNSTPPAAGWPEAPEPDTWPTRGWQTRTPEEQGLDSSRLQAMFTAIQERQLDLHSLLVVRNGYLVVEAYFDPYEAGDLHTVESNTKSVIATLIGIAIDQGKIGSVDQTLLDFFPGATIQNRDAYKDAIRLHDLLAMTPGLDCEDFSAAAQGMYASPDWVQYLLDLPMKTAPGETWVYCSGAAHLASAILERSTGMQARGYANQFLFKPLGIPGATLANWGGDPQNITNGIAGLYLRPADLAKLGLLYLHKGRWEDQQVVSRAWIEAATREQAYIGPDEYVGGLDRRFGYLFSIFPDQGMYGYLGRAGQELFVIPEQNLVVVFTAGLEVGQEASLLDLVNEFIRPAVQSESALPDNPQAQAALAASIQAAAGQTRPAPPLPQIALEISGQTYALEQNPFGWEDIRFEFQPGAATGAIRMSGAPELTVGLDNRYRLTVDPEGNSRPIGLRGRWQADGSLLIEDITLGEFSKTMVTAAFEPGGLTLTAVNLNFPGEPVLIHGSLQP